jgi:hypothetical protein
MQNTQNKNSFKQQLMEDLRNSIWGVRINNKKDDDIDNRNLKSFVPPNTDDGAQLSQGFNTYGAFFNGDYNSFQNETILIDRYRDMAESPELDPIITGIVNDIIVVEEESEPVSIDLDKVNFDESVKKNIIEEWDHITYLFDLRGKGHQRVREFYVDGRQFFHCIVDISKPEDGIHELRKIDSKNIKKKMEPVDQNVKNLGTGTVIEQPDYFSYFEYFPPLDGMSGINIAQNGLKIEKDMIAYAYSGKLDLNSKIMLSYLHPAIKPHNNLKYLEDASVIYQVVRAPERRVFNLETMGMKPTSVPKFMSECMEKFKNKLSYDATTGEIMNERRYITMLQDYFIPMRDGKGSTIDTLSGATNWSMEGVMYFRKKLFEALGIPQSRISDNNSGASFTFGRPTEISRDEVNFNKFIERFRNQYNKLFKDALHLQLILRGIIEEEDWVELDKNLIFVWATDNYFAELKEQQILSERISTLNSLKPYIGKGGYFSKESVRKNVLKQTEEEIVQIDKENENAYPAEISPERQAFELKLQADAMPEPGMKPPSQPYKPKGE